RLRGSMIFGRATAKGWLRDRLERHFGPDIESVPLTDVVALLIDTVARVEEAARKANEARIDRAISSVDDRIPIICTQKQLGEFFGHKPKYTKVAEALQKAGHVEKFSKVDPNNPKSKIRVILADSDAHERFRREVNGVATKPNAPRIGSDSR